MPPKDLQSIQLLQIAAAQPEEEEKSEPKEPKETPPPAAEILKEPTLEAIPVEAEPPKPAESFQSAGSLLRLTSSTVPTLCLPPKIYGDIVPVLPLFLQILLAELD